MRERESEKIWFLSVLPRSAIGYMRTRTEPSPPTVHLDSCLHSEIPNPNLLPGSVNTRNMQGLLEIKDTHRP